MCDTATTTDLERASTLMAGFSLRSGLTEQGGSGTPGDPTRRYLWTDALALLNFLALNNTTGDKTWDLLAQRIIQQVHGHLGKFAHEDSRVGWLSGLGEEKAQQHPTLGGLRIGKKRPERGEHEPYDAQLEWERDGQYYHYHTRWIMALLSAATHFDQSRYARWAAELSLTGARFIEQTKTGLRMYWKMSVDLSRPLIPVMGAHDPLDGLLCALQVQNHGAGKDQSGFARYIDQLEHLCMRSRWATDDELGLGSLALNVVRATHLQTQAELPSAIQPRTLLADLEQGIAKVVKTFAPSGSANYRLAFRECGLSLGLRCLHSHLAFLKEQGLKPHFDEATWQLADDIEGFWLRHDNQQVATFLDHQDINEVSLAASLLAKSQPGIFTAS
jgi:hypothetical protein